MLGAGSSASSSTSHNPAYKRFTAAELRARWEKGLCYYCDEKYNPQHRCKTSCYLLVGPDEVEELLRQEENEAVTTEGVQEDQLNSMEVVSEISINALSRQFHPNTLRVIGKCGGKEVKILIDSGSNNNFIRPDAVEKLKLQQMQITGFKVGTGSGAFLYCKNKCEQVSLFIQGQEFTTDLFTLEIKGSDIVFGVQWLIELGDVVTNYKELTM